jgi:hypothetical protein
VAVLLLFVIVITKRRRGGEIAWSFFLEARMGNCGRLGVDTRGMGMAPDGPDE